MDLEIEWEGVDQIVVVQDRKKVAWCCERGNECGASIKC